MTRAVLTLAVGKPVYLRFALNLARSFRFWHRESDIGFWIATDLPCAPGEGIPGVQYIWLRAGQMPDGFSAKLHLDDLAPADRTLFIDADCLCFERLDRVFDLLKGRPVGVIGSPVSTGEWFGDLPSVLRQVGLASVPKFNGGLYYLERGAKARAVYESARSLEPSYDSLGLVRLRGKPNDELLMALAMGLHGLSAAADDGSVLGDPQACPGPMTVSVLRGHATLTNPPPPDPLHQAWYALEVIHPAIVHFLGDWTDHWRYRAEAHKLKLIDRDTNPLLTDMCVNATFSAFERGREAVKSAGRPLYRRLFGARQIKVSPRIAS